MYLYLKNKAKCVKELEDNLTKLTSQVVTFYSRKKQIDRALETAIYKEKNDEYHILLKQFQVFVERYIKLILKYNKHCHKLPIAAHQEASAAVYGPDFSTLFNVIDALQSRKPSVFTRKFFTLATLSRDVTKLHDHISRVTDEMKAENVIIEKEIEPVTGYYDVVHIPSFVGYVEKIFGYLSEDENRTVAVLGPIGAGKTIVMKMLSNQLKDDDSSNLPQFEIVIWINYSEQVDARYKSIIDMLQFAIMERLRIIKEKTDIIEANGDIISAFLMHKKYLLLVDQVTSTIDFDLVGIRKQHKFGKIVVASSTKTLFKETIDCRVEIQPLSNDDSLLLFRKFCDTSYDRRFKIIAEDIVASSGGLPEVVMAVAKSLKCKKDIRLWRHACSCLERKGKGNASEDFINLKRLDNAYKSVYDKLETSIKNCLLFAASFPGGEDINKDYLVECWNNRKFLEVDDTPEVAGVRGELVLRALADEYLLENCNSDAHVKVPVFVRRVVLAHKYSDEERGAPKRGGLKENHRQPSKYGC